MGIFLVFLLTLVTGCKLTQTTTLPDGTILDQPTVSTSTSTATSIKSSTTGTAQSTSNGTNSVSVAKTDDTDFCTPLDSAKLEIKQQSDTSFLLTDKSKFNVYFDSIDAATSRLWMFKSLHIAFDCKLLGEGNLHYFKNTQKDVVEIESDQNRISNPDKTSQNVTNCDTNDGVSQC